MFEDCRSPPWFAQQSLCHFRPPSCPSLEEDAVSTRLNRCNRKIITPLEGRGSIRDPEERHRESSLVTNKHRKVLRQLLTVLEDLISENEAKEDRDKKGIDKLEYNTF